jgi:hypothetical protein
MNLRTAYLVNQIAGMFLGFENLINVFKAGLEKEMTQ